MPGSSTSGGVEDGKDGGPTRVRLELVGERIARLLRDGESLGDAVLAPEILTSAATSAGEEYHPIILADAPRVLVQSVMSVESSFFSCHVSVVVYVGCLCGRCS